MRTPSGHVTLRCVANPQLVLVALLGANAPVLSGGRQEWNEVEVAHSAPIRTRGNVVNYQLVIDLILGEGDSPDSCVEQMETLDAMVSPDGDPCVVHVAGAFPPMGPALAKWVIDDVAYDGAQIYRSRKPIRANVTLTLGRPPQAEAIDVSRIRSNRNGRGKARSPRKVKIRKGESLRQFSKRTTGEAKNWKAILKAQKPPMRSSKDKRLKGGAELIVPASLAKPAPKPLRPDRVTKGPGKSANQASRNRK